MTTIIHAFSEKNIPLLKNNSPYPDDVICTACNPNRTSVPNCNCKTGFYDIVNQEECEPCPYSCSAC